MLGKLKWVVRFITSKTYVLLLDEGATINIPLARIDSRQSEFILNAQLVSLYEFRDRLEELTHEYEDEVRQVADKQTKRHAGRKTVSRKHTVS